MLKNKNKILGILFYLIISLSFAYQASAEGLALTWAKNIGGSGNYITIFKTAVDASGNSYLAGYFTGTIDFDPGDGTTNLVSAGANDIFIAKFDTSGNLSWAKRIGDVPDTGWWGGDVAKSVAIDASGNVYVSGFFSGTVDFDPGDGSFPLTVVGGVDIFILKLDTSGNFVWAKQMGGASYEESVVTMVDTSGNVYLSGHFQGTVDFDPGIDTHNLTATGGGGDMFVAKLDTDGSYVWAKGMLGGSGYDYGRSIVVDSSGNVYVFGPFTGTVDFDPGAGTNNITSAGDNDMFIIKLTSLGALDWVKTIGGTSADSAWTIVLDSTNNYLYTTGAFQGTVDFDPGAGDSSLTSAGSNDIFIQKLDSSGNFEWVKQMGGTGSDLAYSISLDSSNNIYTAGFFNSTVDFDPGAGVSNLTSAGGDDIFLNKLNSSGNFVYVKQMGGSGNEDVKSVFADSSGNTVYVYGQMYANTDLDPNAGVDTHTIIGVRDLFLVKLTYDSTGPTITSVSTSDITNTSATITWTTNEVSSTLVEYSLDSSYNTSTTETDIVTGVTSHTVSLSNLNPCTTYQFRVKSNDASSNLATDTNHTLEMPGCPSSGSSAGSRAYNLFAMGKIQDAQNIIKQYPNALNQIPSEDIKNQLTEITLNPISNVNPTQNFSIKSTLRMWASNIPEVTKLQQFLNSQGNILVLDGKFGPLTYNAVKEFQAKNNLKVDGIVGPLTWGVMSSLVK